MELLLSDILDYSIVTSNISVVNSDNGSVYFIPYDGTLFDEILEMAPHLVTEIQTSTDDQIDNLRFCLICQYSHVGADNNLYAKYTLQMGDTTLVTEVAPIIKGLTAKPHSLLRAARKCARKMIEQEKLALKQGMIKTFMTNAEHTS